MGLRIWETDPEAAPKPRNRFADDLVGRFRSGYTINNRPASLEQWRVTTGDPEVADRIHELLDGEQPQQWPATGEDNIEVFTDAEAVKIIVDGPSALRQKMVLWGRAGAIRECDGVEQMGDNTGKPCECPASFQERKDAAKKGTGCQPSITVFFKLFEAPDLGRFKFTSGSWSLVRDIGDAERRLEEINGPAVAMLRLEVVEYEANGRPRKFTKPVLDVLGPYDDPEASESDYEDEPPL